MIFKNQVKYIQSLGQKKSRDAENKFVAEGPKIVNELIVAGNCKVIKVFALKEWIRNNTLSGPVTEVIEVSADELKKLSQLSTPNQVVAVAEKILWKEETVMKGKLSLALDTIQDPGNMGTIIRTADWFGIKTIFCSNDSADMYNPKVVQATMGSLARVRVEYVDLGTWLQIDRGIRSYAAALNGIEITKMEKLTEGIIIIGNESKGIREDILKHVNVQITIPGRGKAESLNAAVATGIILSYLV